MRVEARLLNPLDSVGTSLARAEETIALVPRATPLEVHAEIHRLTSAAARGQRLRPRFRYAPRPELGGVRRSLEGVARETASYGREGALFARRAEELELEARLAERVGAPGFAELAAERFRAPHGALEASVAEFVDQALARGIPGPSAGAQLTASDDRGSMASLLVRLVRGAAELALPLRVEVRPEQLAIAATGHGLVAIRPGVLLPAGVAARIALHELLGHALPRARSTHASSTLLRAGTAGCVECEEGRALLVEERAGYLDGPRRRELALRHLAALAVQRGADFDETVRELVGRGADACSAIEIAVR
ncbi:MAG TPA: tyrosine/phenylalanine carboxypeptidase domain-containing protein, partial [Polyangiaceae bacterium]|nr:tyrosine/phenylalanine carboxypeptidase domain-containing protein [Polyangiaceae bacterium]